jgi:hypothetical protein
MSESRICSQCKAPDREILQGQYESVHLVRPEIRYFRTGEDITAPLRAQGWIPKSFQGRRSIYRMMCVNCLNENEVRDGVWRQLKENAKKLEKPEDNADAEFYAVLCEVN